MGPPVADARLVGDRQRCGASAVDLAERLCLIIQVTGMIVFPITNDDSSWPFQNAWVLPLGILLTSLGKKVHNFRNNETEQN